MIIMIKEIYGEDASQHWFFLDVKDKVVLDLGSGIWYTTNPDEYTPIYFERMGASKVIGVDASPEQFTYFTEHHGNNPKFAFVQMKIATDWQIRELLETYKPDVIKMDIEGFEIHMKRLTAEDMSCVKEVGFEFHAMAILDDSGNEVRISGEEMKQFLIEKLREWGFSDSNDTQLDTGVLIHAKR